MRGDKRPLPAPLSAELVQPEKVDAKLNASIHNRFDVEVIDSRTGEVRQRAQGENVICNQMWGYMFNSNYEARQWNNYIQYGSGVGNPSAVDTALFSYVNYGTPTTIDDVTEFNRSLNTCSLRRKIVLLENAAVGITITEVGIARYGSSGLCTHAMLKDANGNQITIVKTSTDIINIYATIYVHWGNLPNYLSISGNNNLLRFAQGIYYNPIFPSQGIPCSFNLSYNISFFPSEKKVKFIASRIGSSEGNTGFSPMLLMGDAMALDLISAGYLPQKILQETISTGDGATKDYTSKFMPILDGSATVYVNGVNVSAKVDAFIVGERMSLADFCDDVFVPIDETGTRLVCFQEPSANGACFYAENLKYQNNIGLLGWNCKLKSGNTNFFCDIFVSNDLTTWVKAGTGSQGDVYIEIPPQFLGYRYYKFVSTCTGDGRWGFTSGLKCKLSQSNNIHLADIPPVGSIITMSYTPKCIAKDANHVFDFSCELQFGEYTPPVV